MSKYKLKIFFAIFFLIIGFSFFYIKLYQSKPIVPSAKIISPENFRDAKLSLQEFIPKKSKRFEFPYGLNMFYYFDDKTPLVNGSLIIPFGSGLDPLDKKGLAYATLDLMRKGGTLNYSPAELEKKLDDLGAKITTSHNTTFSTLSFECLADDFEEVLTIFSEMILYPRFDAEQINIWKGLNKNASKRRKDDPELVANIIFNSIVYGDDNVYGKPFDSATIDNISISDIKDLHLVLKTLNPIYLAVSGAISEQQVNDLVTKNLSKEIGAVEALCGDRGGELFDEIVEKRAKGESIFSELSNSNRRPGIYVFTKKDATQSRIILGHRGPTLVNDDMQTIAIFNNIFGTGGLDNKLFNILRTQGGFAYSIYGGLFGADPIGLFKIELGTKTESTFDAIKKVFDVIRIFTQFAKINFADTSVFEQKYKDTKLKYMLETVLIKEIEIDVEQTKQALSQQFVFKFAEPKDLPFREAYLAINKFPDDYDETYLEKLNNVTLKDLQNVINKKIQLSDIAPGGLHSNRNSITTDISNLYIVIVGNITIDEVKLKLGENFEYHQIDFDEAMINYN